MDIGFTGSRRGMTEAQITAFAEIMGDVTLGRQVSFHHGACIGADEQAAEIAKDLHCIIVAHPSTLIKYTTTFESNKTWSPLDPLARNKVIVDVSDILIATPKQVEEILHSGTWMTIRYARKQDKPCYIVRPDGSYVIS